MLPEEREYTKRAIARLIDYPSVYMGGPSPRALALAARILDSLDRQGRLCETTCQHDEYDTYERHGIACPSCGTHIVQT